MIKIPVDKDKPLTRLQHMQKAQGAYWGALFNLGGTAYTLFFASLMKAYQLDLLATLFVITAIPTFLVGANHLRNGITHTWNAVKPAEKASAPHPA